MIPQFMIILLVPVLHHHQDINLLHPMIMHVHVLENVLVLTAMIQKLHMLSSKQLQAVKMNQKNSHYGKCLKVE